MNPICPYSPPSTISAISAGTARAPRSTSDVHFNPGWNSQGWWVSSGLITGGGHYDDGPGGLTDGYRAYLLDASSLLVMPSSRGDFDADGDVDGDDLAEWSDGFGLASGAVRTDGDADVDNDVDGTDFLVWQRQLGSSTPAVSANAPVPEPATLLLAIVAMAAIHFAGGRIRQQLIKT